MNCSTPGFPVLHYLQQFAQTHVHRVNDDIQPSPPCHLRLPSVFPSIRVFSKELVFHIRWPEYWSFSFNVSPSSEYSGLISFWIDWFDLLSGESHGQRSLAGCSPWGCKESDMTEQVTHTHTHRVRRQQEISLKFWSTQHYIVLYRLYAVQQISRPYLPSITETFYLLNNSVILSVHRPWQPLLFSASVHLTVWVI